MKAFILVSFSRSFRRKNAWRLRPLSLASGFFCCYLVQRCDIKGDERYAPRLADLQVRISDNMYLKSHLLCLLLDGNKWEDAE